MKSALLAEATISVAAGLDWHGYRSKGAAGVVYFALERADLVKRRLRAHKRLLGLQGTPIAVAGGVIELTHPEAFKKVIDTMRSAQTVLNADIGMIVIDTFAKLIAAGGGDENSAKDQGAVFANLQRVKDVTGAHVALIGHTGKDESRGMRGSNAAPGDFDLEVRISGDDVRTATVTKANDAPEGPLFSFKSEVHEFGADEDGDPVTVNIVSRVDVSAQIAPKPSEPKLSTNQRVMFRLLAEAGPAGLSVQAWNEAAREQGIANKQRLRELHGALMDEIAELSNAIDVAASAVEAGRDSARIDTGLTVEQFEAAAAPIEAKEQVPWLRRGRVVDLERGVEREPTADELANGIEAQTLDEFNKRKAA